MISVYLDILDRLIVTGGIATRESLPSHNVSARRTSVPHVAIATVPVALDSEPRRPLRADVRVNSVRRAVGSIHHEVIFILHVDDRSAGRRASPNRFSDIRIVPTRACAVI